jgi:hypothetical protein
MTNPNTDIEKIIKRLDKVWESGINKNKCPYCDYKCKTIGWRNGIIRHIAFNHEDKHLSLGRQDRIRLYFRKALSQYEAVREKALNKKVMTIIKEIKNSNTFKEKGWNGKITCGWIVNRLNNLLKINNPL